jgi:hypothetical protein
MVCVLAASVRTVVSVVCRRRWSVTVCVFVATPAVGSSTTPTR